MATDYDSPGHRGEPNGDESPQQIRARAESAQSPQADVDEQHTAQLPGADLSRDELTVNAVAQQPDEFTCTSCRRTAPRRRLAVLHHSQSLCQDCV